MALLLSPLRVGSLTLSNRLVLPPMATAKAESDGRVSRALLDYYGEKTEGGCFSLVIIEHSFIEASGRASENQLSVSEDDVVEGLKKLADLVHRNGSKCVMQINHAGSAGARDLIGAGRAVLNDSAWARRAIESLR